MLENTLMDTLNALEKDIHTDDNIMQDYETTKHEYELLQKRKTQGLIVRSRAQYVEHGERNSKYFLSLEKRNQSIKHIKCLVNESGKIISHPTEILKEHEMFYQKLYTESEIERHIDPSARYFLEDENLATLKPQSREMCDSFITMEEYGKALKQLSNNKAPGSDGFPSDFYKFFWIDIRDAVIDSFNYAFKCGRLSIVQRRSILSIIPKKQKDIRYLKNWRPLSLLNTDYKILTKALATRLQCVLDEVISPDQNGYIKNRFIGENIRTIADVIELANKTNETGLIALLDFEKAFDTVNWLFYITLYERLILEKYFVSG